MKPKHFGKKPDVPWVKHVPSGKNLIPIRDNPDSVQILYDLLAERTPEVSISHVKMPTMEEHAEFVKRHKYRAWYLVCDKDLVVGAAYISRKNEIGVQIFKAFQRKGYGEYAIKDIMRRWRNENPRQFLANINPHNQASMRLFQRCGFNLLQLTFRAEAPES